ncbi:MAG: HAD family phosphatase [Lachnospiraceae bacterium]|nr:HAD family phosphatase [Lachnospiraceae bacterium]
MNTFLFDFDGTLVDSMPTFVGVMLRVLDENNIPYEKDIVKIITPLGYDATAKYYVELGVPMSAEEIKTQFHKYAVEEYSYHIPAKAHVIDAVRELKARGCDLNVLTASPHPMLDPCLKRLGIYDLFTNVWSCDDFATTKANPEIYRMAAQKIGKPVEEICFLDDNYNADKTAKEAGMKVCGVFDASSEEYQEEMKILCDWYVYDFAELMQLTKTGIL